MQTAAVSFSPFSLLDLGLNNLSRVHYQLVPEELVAQVLNRKEGLLSDSGALVINTGAFTGRSPKDKFIVNDASAADINWNEFNIPISSAHFDIIYKKAIQHLNSKSGFWVRDCFACADPAFRLGIRVITELPAHNLFAYNMFLRPAEEELEDFIAEWHVIAVPGLQLDPEECGTRQQNASVISFERKMIIVAGSGYTGEIKKGVFTILNYLLPKHKSVLSMHCSANMGRGGDTAIFFGLSGTGKTTLSADPDRFLIGDDEHGWTDHGIFNFEGGCYAKTIHLSGEKEPEIYRAIRPGALVENMRFIPGTNEINFEDGSITENTRVSYPLDYIGNSVEPSVGEIPENIFFLTCDAFGVLPPISKLNAAQAMYQFISGYTAKVAGTETDVKEPKPTFSACFGAPFIPLHPGVYAEMLGKKLNENQVDVWLVNTGWTGGAAGTGKRMKLDYTRAMITAALKGWLDKVDYEIDPVFGFQVPKECIGVPSGILNPRNTWADKAAYDEKARFLAALFVNNFQQFEDGVSIPVRSAYPKS